MNYYQLLGLPATASDTEIRRAYLKLSLQWHPDKRRQLPEGTVQAAPAGDVFQLIQEAYTTLSCPEKRCLYDFVGAFAALAEATAEAFPAGSAARHHSPGPRSCSPPWASSFGDPHASWFPPSPSPRCPSASASASHASSCPSSDSCASSNMHTHGSGGGGCVLLQASAFATMAPAHSSHQPHPPTQQPQLQPHTDAVAVEQLPARRGTSPALSVAVEAANSKFCPTAAAAASPTLSPGAVLGKRRAPGADQPSAPSPPPPSGRHAAYQPTPQLPAIPPPPAGAPCASIADIGGAHPPSPHPPSHAPGGCAAAAAAPPAPSAAPAPSRADVTHPLWLTLEEMYSGCVKQLRLARRVCRASAPGALGSAGGGAGLAAACLPPAGAAGAEAGGSVVCVEELFRVVVQPGWRAGMKVTFPGKGDQLPGCVAGDMVLVVAQAAHATFERRGHDLHTVLPVPLLTALTGGCAPLTTLDGRTLHLQLGPGCLQPASEAVVVVKGEGMPIMPGRGRGPRAAAPPPPSTSASAPAPAGAGVKRETGTGVAPAALAERPVRGDLHVRFEVKFPEDLTLEQKRELREVLLG